MQVRTNSSENGRTGRAWCGAAGRALQSGDFACARRFLAKAVEALAGDPMEAPLLAEIAEAYAALAE